MLVSAKAGTVVECLPFDPHSVVAPAILPEQCEIDVSLSRNDGHTTGLHAFGKLQNFSCLRVGHSLYHFVDSVSNSHILPRLLFIALVYPLSAPQARVRARLHALGYRSARVKALLDMV